MKDGRVKATLFQGLRVCGALGLFERVAPGVPILAYHGVTADAGRARALGNRRRLHVPRALFAEHLDEICTRWRPLALGEVVEALVAGRTLPRRTVVLTFDDGYRNVLTEALPLLRARRVPATVFVLTGDPRQALWQDRLEAALEATAHAALEWQGRTLSLDGGTAREASCALIMRACEALGAEAREATLARLVEALGGPGTLDDDERRRLTWDEVRTLRAAGLEIGSHADVHEPLTARPADALAPLLRESHATLARELGESDARLPLAYPYGARSAAVVQAARAAGFGCALGGVPRRVREGASLFDLGRFLIGADDDRLRLRLSLSGLRGLWQGDPWPPHR